MNVVRTRLLNLCKVITKGTTPTSIGYSFSDSGIGFLRVQNINGGKVNYDQQTLFIDELTHKALSRSQIVGGDILVSIAGTIGRAGIVPDNAPPLNCNQAVAIVRTNEDIFRPYLRHWLESNDAQSQIIGATVTGTISNLSLTQIGNLQIPLPPLEEQKRIAEILDQAEELRTKRRNAIAQLDTLTQSIFLEMFGDPVTNLKGWDIQPISAYVAQFQGGKSIEAESGENIVTRNRVLKVSAVTQMKFRPEESKPLPDSYEPSPEHFVRDGDLLFSRANTTEMVGAVAYVKTSPSNLLLPDKLWRFVWKQPTKVLPLFVWVLFQTSVVRREISRRATGTSGSMKNSKLWPGCLVYRSTAIYLFNLINLIIVNLVKNVSITGKIALYLIKLYFYY